MTTLLDVGMRYGFNLGDVVIYMSGHSVTVHDRNENHYVVTETGERHFAHLCREWVGRCPAQETLTVAARQDA